MELSLLFLHYIAAQLCCWMFQATPKLSEDKVRQCVDERLQGDYPPKAVAKVFTETLLKYILQA